MVLCFSSGQVQTHCARLLAASEDQVLLHFQGVGHKAVCVQVHWLHMLGLRLNNRVSDVIFTHLPIKLVEFPIERGDEFDVLATVVELHGGDRGGEEGPGLGGRAPQHLSPVGEVQGGQLKRTDSCSKLYLLLTRSCATLIGQFLNI